MINRLYETIVDTWTSTQPPRFAKKALVVLFAIDVLLTCAVVVGGSIELGNIAIHSIHPQRAPAKPIIAQNIP